MLNRNSTMIPSPACRPRNKAAAHDEMPAWLREGRTGEATAPKCSPALDDRRRAAPPTLEGSLARARRTPYAPAASYRVMMRPTASCHPASRAARSRSPIFETKRSPEEHSSASSSVLSQKPVDSPASIAAPQAVLSVTAGRRTLPHDDIEHIIFKCGVEHLLDLAIQSMDLVDEEHIAVFEVGEDGRKIPWTGDGRAACGSKWIGEILRR